MSAALVAAARERPLLLDGGLGTELEAQGAAVDSALWSARVLLDEPERIVAAHRAFADAGARVAVTASYQVSASGFAAAGLAPGLVEHALRESVALARRAQSGWVAASVGPYGASLGDGSEYRGDDTLTVDELTAWHRPRLEALAAASPDLLAVETIPSVREVRAVVAALAGSPVPAWICVSGRSGRTAAGEPLADAFAVATASTEVIGVGVNCCPPGDVAEAVRIARSVTDKLVVVYPNSGEEWDAVDRRWTGDAAFDPALVASWRADGADLIGGCCRIGPAAIAALGRSLECSSASSPPAVP
ncbi:homocysteine S-methyltransferase [Rathayibacter rathayi NCPPB 2980 = VKM Ac-1601]|uniref:homocysteine S-methyltransferase n=1 Tax=Rathayibacter rathayi TaxID=33887 RepID=UPI000BCDD614|nr:homocysteine S-methyltransferase [Rathayibacter rathayi]MWV73184.1 homocysteine S-methyltransferase [Rathayibacter rathayi NCPPB 2980 = VKM Ac-1601]PPG72560.1 homocysteine S-methyltransferase [Rathayibacter rathayi]PPG81131.1 homocysteine S-methyltransferase [Rathayibacter rathayi]PPI70084.1 homocysteine S-methyltransferase [Rathayibacter rathayi]TWD69773.1 homocysteine S-methyltransferase [Rathayibacter rathayi]